VLATMPLARIEELVRVSMLSPLVLTRCVVRSMLAESRGRIVNIASMLGINGYPGVAAYSATKAALIGFTRALASEVGPSSITVNAVAPGFLETPMTEDFADLRERVARRAPLRRNRRRGRRRRISAGSRRQGHHRDGGDRQCRQLAL